MITNFEELTYDVTEEEKRVAQLISKSIQKNHVGKDKAITSREIIVKLANASNPEHRISMGDARLRKIINYIRQSGMCPCLIATSKGYYVSNDREEIGKYIKSLDERVNEIAKIRDVMIKQMEIIPYISKNVD